MRRSAPILAMSALFVMSCCDKTPPVPVAYEYSYHPLDIGHTVEYYVDSVIFNPLLPGGRDTVHWQMKEVVESTFIDNLGRTAHRIERYLRADDSAQWFISDIWYAVRTQTTLERVEENLRFVRLIFPPAEGDVWQGNIYIPSTVENGFYNDWDYEYVQVHAADTVNGFTFDSTLTVLEVDDSSLVDRRYSTATYAKGIGLVFKELQNLVIDDTVIHSGYWPHKANRGYITTVRIRSF